MLRFLKLRRIRRRLRRPQTTDRVAAVKEVETLDGAPAADILLEALRDRDPLVRRQAIYTVGLLRLRDPRLLEPLVAELGEPNPDMRMVAARALGELGNPSACEPLRRLLKDGDWLVRTSARIALHQLEGDTPASAAPAIAAATATSASPPAPTSALPPAVSATARGEVARPENLPPDGPLSTDADAVALLDRLCCAYERWEPTEIARLEPQARRLGRALDERGGLREMQRICDLVADQPGKAMLRKLWNGIGSWHA